MTTFQKYLAAAVGVGAVIGAVFYFGFADVRHAVSQMQRDTIAPAVVKKEDIVATTTTTPTTTPTVAKVVEPKKPVIVPEDQPTQDPQPIAPKTSFNLDVPFMTQAPHSNWDEVHNETCEEASVLMAYWFATGNVLPNKDTQEDTLQEIIAWENENFGDYKDTTIAQTIKILQQHLRYDKATVLENPTIADIEREIFSGHAIILPAAGKMLQNPNFKNGGPLYHMLVVRGFDSRNFYTNDPGTRNGKNYAYEKNHLMRALHDWNGGDVLNGAKRVIVVR